MVGSYALLTLGALVVTREPGWLYDTVGTALVKVVVCSVLTLYAPAMSSVCIPSVPSSCTCRE